jgi:hypothetical protein
LSVLKRFGERWTFGASVTVFICIVAFFAFAFSLIAAGIMMEILQLIFGEFSEQGWENAIISTLFILGPFFVAWGMEHAPTPDYEIKHDLSEMA